MTTIMLTKQRPLGTLDSGLGLQRRAIMRTAGIAILCVMTLAVSVSTVRAHQPPAGTPDGFVPVDDLKPQEQLPAAPLVMGAYAIAWLAVFGYLWSIWQRLSRVERELAEVSRRVPAGGGPR